MKEAIAFREDKIDLVLLLLMVILGGINFATIDLRGDDQSDQALCLDCHSSVKPVNNSFDLRSVCIAVKMVLNFFELSAKIQWENISASEDFITAADYHGNGSCFILVQIRFLLVLSGKCVDVLEMGLDTGNMQNCKN